MKNLLLIFSVLLSGSLFGQIGSDGTGFVHGYYIGPGAFLGGVNLSDADLNDADLSLIFGINANFSRASISGANLNNAYVRFANFTGAFLRHTNLSGASLKGANLSGAQLTNADLNGADLSDANLNGANLHDANLTSANMNGLKSGNITSTLILSTPNNPNYAITITPTLPSGYSLVNGYIVGPSVDLANADLSGAGLSGANLTGVDLTNADLSGADISGANLTGVDLTNADLSGANLTGVDLANANINGLKSGGITNTPTLPSGYSLVNGYIVGPSVDLANADLNGTDLSGVNLSNANLTNANLTNANLTNANLTNADITATNFINADITAIIWPDSVPKTEYDAILAEKDTALAAQVNAETARDTALAEKASAEAERDARHTQAAYDEVVAERDAALAEKASAEAERDARPTQNAYDALVAENSEKYNLKEIADLRTGSKMIEIVNGQATLSMDVESSDELGSWTVEGNLSTVIPIQDGVDKKFFRFKMDNSDSSDKDINFTIGDTEYNEAAIIEALAEQYGVPTTWITITATGG